MSSEDKISIELKVEGDWQRLIYQGPVNENTKTALARYNEQFARNIILDMGQVTYLNSCGIRDWSYFVRSLKNARQVAFDRCPDEVVRAMNMIISFHSQLPVRSVLRTYCCPLCEHEQVETFVEGVHYRRGQIPKLPLILCAACGQKTEGFESDEEYFVFLET